ncbi:MAG: glycosyltransferase [Erysipelotrichaceae bacterium]|jgi:glycosyltransferase involved in cell wall biosynthesis
MKISIIVPVYNVEKQLPKCLDSLINQTYKNIEINLIDNNSTDNSLKICQKYAEKDERIKIYHQPLQGAANARNLGLEKATGELIGFVDSDDYADLNMYQLLIEQLIRLNNDIVVCNAYTLTEDSKFLRTYFNPEKTSVELTGDDILNYIYSSSGVIWNTLMKKEVIGDLKFYNHIFYGEDLLFLLEVLGKAKSASILDKPLYYYYVTREGNLLSSKIDKRSLQFLEINLMSIDYLRKRNLISLSIDRTIKSSTEVIRKMTADDDKQLVRKHRDAIKTLFKQFSFREFMNFILYGEISKTRKLILFFLKLAPTLYIAMYPYYKKLSNR